MLFFRLCQLTKACQLTDVRSREHRQNIQESCTVAKMTARCALYVGYSLVFYHNFVHAYVHYFARILF